MANHFVDYAFKSYVLKEHSDLLKRQKRSSLYDYSLNKFINEGVVSYALTTSKEYYKPSTELIDYCRSKDLLKEYRECIRINNASIQRTIRLKERVRTMLLNGSCLFLTLTFTDDTLAKTNEKQRRVAVVRFLKKYDCMYIANIDFGATNHREHYHALINCNKVDSKLWKLGNLDFKRVRLKEIETDKTKLSKYIAKLSNHAIKETARRGALIYSR